MDKSFIPTGFRFQKHTMIPDTVKPLFDEWIRDTHVILGGDGYYYLTGTTRSAGMLSARSVNDGIRLWKSPDLVNWEPLGLVWSFEKDATWQNVMRPLPEDSPQRREQDHEGNVVEPVRRAIYAPEIHYINGNYFITASLNWVFTSRLEDNGRTFLLRSKSGLPEGPYENVGEGPLTNRIDSSLFVDDDGEVYYLWQDGSIARMKADLSGFAEAPRRLQQTLYEPEPYCEGVYLIKHEGKYHLMLAIWTKEYNGEIDYFPNGKKISYDCVIASSDSLYGPYGPRYTSITGGGHNNLFKDKAGNYWATMFGNPVEQSYAPFYARPAIIPMTWDNGRIFPTNSN